MKFDTEFRDTHANVPRSLRMKPFDSSFTDHAGMVFNRLNIDKVYL